jgi:hypothetical protein
MRLTKNLVKVRRYSHSQCSPDLIVQSVDYQFSNTENEARDTLILLNVARNSDTKRFIYSGDGEKKYIIGGVIEYGYGKEERKPGKQAC